MKTEKAENFRLFPENGNGKWKFVFLGGQTINGNYVCYFSKCARLWWYIEMTYLMGEKQSERQRKEVTEARQR
jgi:hypothetical protein